MKIKKLRIKLTLKAAPSRTPERSQGYANPQRIFEAPPTMTAMMAAPPDHRTDEQSTDPEPIALDPREVADEVYRLMREDLRVARIRGLGTY